MDIVLTIHIPNDKLAEKLAEEGLTREKFKGELVRTMLDEMDAEELCPGATCGIELKD